MYCTYIGNRQINAAFIHSFILEHLFQNPDQSAEGWWAWFGVVIADHIHVLVLEYLRPPRLEQAVRTDSCAVRVYN